MSLQIPHRPGGRRIRHVAIVCFSVSGIAFVACGLGLLVSHALTGSLVISGTAAVGLIYLAMGLMNLGFEPETDELVERLNRPESGEFEPGADAESSPARKTDEIVSSSRDRG